MRFDETTTLNLKKVFHWLDKPENKTREFRMRTWPTCVWGQYCIASGLVDKPTEQAFIPGTDEYKALDDKLGDLFRDHFPGMLMMYSPFDDGEYDNFERKFVTGEEVRDKIKEFIGAYA